MQHITDFQFVTYISFIQAKVQGKMMGEDSGVLGNQRMKEEALKIDVK